VPSPFSGTQAWSAAIKMLDLKVDPDFDNLREDPTFVELVQRVGLP
jgi:hypothetical protein